MRAARLPDIAVAAGGDSTPWSVGVGVALLATAPNWRKGEKRYRPARGGVLTVSQKSYDYVRPTPSHVVLIGWRGCQSPFLPAVGYSAASE
jgi:hypothetical protein